MRHETQKIIDRKREREKKNSLKHFKQIDDEEFLFYFYVLITN